MALLRDSPYIWVTWLTKFLASENSCEQGCLVPVPTRRMELGDSYKERPVHRRGRAGERRQHGTKSRTDGIMQARTWESLPALRTG